MDRIMVTGGTGFVGRNVVPILKEKYEVFAPSRKELDVRSEKDVKNFVTKNKIAKIVHCANPNPVKNPNADFQSNMFEDSMRIFMNIYSIKEYVDKIIYLGSGAEFDKQYDMKDIREEEFGRSIPSDIYGCTKYIMNELALNSKNVYNMRLFACYGPTDADDKFITHVIKQVMFENCITIRQNCMFDYIHVFDLAKVLDYAISNELEYHDYNVASGRKISLENIAKIVLKKMQSRKEIVIGKEGWNKEYTCNISRIENWGITDSFISLEKGIELQIEKEKERFGE